MTFEVKVYDKCKYIPDSKVKATAVLKEVDSLAVVRISDEEIYRMGFDEADEYGEYCIITFMNGETATYRNSHVDVFNLHTR